MTTRVVLGLIVGLAAATVPLVAGQTQAPAASAAAAKPSYKVPMTPWGHPDLQGTWDYKSITPLERNAQLGDRQFYTDAEVKEMEGRAGRRMDEPPPANERAGTIHAAYWTDPGRLVDESRRTSLIVDPPNGRIPPTVGGRRGAAPVPPPGEEEAPGAPAGRGAGAAAAAGGARGAGAAGGRGGARGGGGGRADSWLDRSNLERCITWGIPTALLPGLYNNNIEIVQSPTHVTITHEMVHDTRVIPFGEQQLRDNKVLAGWLGRSVARWEGDTLVVETSNFNGRAGYRGATTNLKLTERYRRIGADRVDFRLTVDDPTVWTAPWTVALTMRTSEGPLVEYACHEGNYGLRNILEVARDEEKAAAEAAAKGK
jgi:hypothetical protein